MPQVKSCRPESLGYDPGIMLADMELEVIRAVLDTIEWYRRRVEQILGIGERTLYRMGEEARMCVGVEGLIGHTECYQGEAPCTCRSWGTSFCRDIRRAELNAQLTETLAAIRAGKSIPADGLFFYVRRGDDFVVRRKCGAAEVARVAIADIASAPVPHAG